MSTSEELWTEDWWARHCQLSGEELGRRLGIDGGHARRKIRAAKEEYPGLSWYDGSKHDSTDRPDTVDEAIGQYKSSHSINEDGSEFSDIPIRMTRTQAKDRSFVLKAHGFDDTWEILSVRNNVWQVFSKNDDDGGHDISTLYSSKLSVRPRPGLSAEKMAEVFERVKPLTKVVRPKNNRDGLFEIPLYDMHFGISDFERYKPTLERIVKRLEDHNFEEVVITVGSDLFHNDNFKGKTANETAVEKINWTKATDDAALFYTTLVTKALENASRVKVIYVKGNHDESMSWMFCRFLREACPDAEYDIDEKEYRKVHSYGKVKGDAKSGVVIGFTHGEKKRKELDRTFMNEFRGFSEHHVREIHIGHLHHESIIDQSGTVIRALPTANETDDWHEEHAYINDNKRFMVFTYTEDELVAIHYV